MKKELLWKKSLKLTKLAILNGSLKPIETSLDKVENGIESFEIRTLKNYKEIGITKIGPKQNPFSPWEPALEISKINDSHVLILNKYPVELGHMLLITNKWKPQNGWIGYEDWEAINKVDFDTNGLWFFNSCKQAGASQPHRHFQLLRRNDKQNVCPRYRYFENRISGIKIEDDILHENAFVIKRNRKDFKTSYVELIDLYYKLCTKGKLGNPYKDEKPLLPYNLLITNDWISLITRKIDFACGFNINALGFAGYFLAKSKTKSKWLKENGSSELLKEVIYKIN